MKIKGNIITKIIAIMIIFQIIFMPITNAASGMTWGEMIDTADDFLDNGKTQEGSDSSVAQTKLNDTINQIYNVLLALGIVAAVLVGAGLGIKYMVGSIEEQAKIKETLMPYVIGCIVVFGAFGIWRILINVLSKV